MPTRYHALSTARLTRTLLSLLVMASCVTARAQGPLPQRIEAILNAAEYRHASWGLLAVDRETGATVYELNADRMFKPASTTKLYSVAAALDALGAGHRFETPVYARGDLDRSGTLRGDLILVAGGDLTLGGRTDAAGRIAFRDQDHIYAGGGNGELTPQDPLAGLNELARQVAANGVKRVTGDVRIDDRLFEKAQSTGSGPSQVTPITVNDNLIDVLVTPGAAGGAAKVEVRPVSASIQVDARVDTVPLGQPNRIEVSTPNYGRVVVRGQIAVGSKPFLDWAEAEDPASFARSLFIEALERAGVRMDASPLARASGETLPPRGDYGKLKRVALLSSPPFAENARLILKVSHNLHASTLPLLVAVQKGKRTLAEGLALQREFLKRAGVDTDAVSFGGGAGGDAADMTTPRATCQLLMAMAKRPDFSLFEEALPVLGVDGTLAAAVGPDSPARGKARAKTGTYSVGDTLNARGLMTSKALAGYLTTAKGRKLAFALFLNNVALRGPNETQKHGQTLGKLCEIFYDAL